MRELPDDVARRWEVEGVPVLPKNGEIGNGRSSSDNVTPTSRGNGAKHAISRLKRDHPELAEEVAAGNLSPNAAAIKAGFRKKTMTISAAQTGLSRKSGNIREWLIPVPRTVSTSPSAFLAPSWAHLGVHDNG